MAQGQNLQLKAARLRNEALRKAKKAVRTGPERKRLVSDVSQCINLIGVYGRDNHRSRTHLALKKDSPESRLVQSPESGRIVSIPVMGGLHHRYERRGA